MISDTADVCVFSVTLASRQGEQPEATPARPHDPVEPDPVEPHSTPLPPDAGPRPAAPTPELPPSANPANWVDHED